MAGEAFKRKMSEQEAQRKRRKDAERRRKRQKAEAEERERDRIARQQHDMRAAMYRRRGEEPPS